MKTPTFLSVALPLGFLLGAIMNVVVLRTSWTRKHRRPGEGSFLLLVGATLLLDLSAFLSLFANLVYVDPTEVRFLVTLFDAGVLLGLAFLPSLLLQTALGFVRAEDIPGWVRPLIYLPVVTLNPALQVFQGGSAQGLMPVIHELLAPYAVWMSFVCALTGWVAFKVSRKDRRPTTAQLTHAMASTLAGVAILFLFTFGLGGYRLGTLFTLLGLLSPNAISLGLALYVYRYPDVGDALQRGLYNMSLALLVLCLYFYVIREVAQKLGQMQLNWEIVQALMLVGLVWAFHPVRNMAQHLYDQVFMRQVARYQQTFQRLGRGLSEAYVPDLPFVLSQAAGVVQEALGAEKAGIYLLRPTPDGLVVEHGHPRPPPRELPRLVELLGSWEEAFVDRFELEHKELAEVMDALDADGVYPFQRDGQLAGLILLGHRGVDRQLGRDEREFLSFVGHSLADAIHKNSLVEQKVRLEREIAQSERMSSLGRLAAGVAHEIKNPLSTIKSIIEVMREEAGDGSPLEEDLEVISEEIARLDRTVKNLLQFIRPDERRDKLVSVESVLQGVLQILDYEARKSQVVIATRLSERTHYVRGMSEEMKSIFFNLVINAIQAMSETGGTLTVTTRTLHAREGAPVDELDRRVEVAVQDSGPGIPPDVQEQIFRPFYTEGKEEGTGLGLAIVRQKVAACEGEIDFESGEQGTTFYVRLPVAGRERRGGRSRAEATPSAEEQHAAESRPPPEAEAPSEEAPAEEPISLEREAADPEAPAEAGEGEADDTPLLQSGPQLRRIK